jgi:hypothetical protein
VVQHGVRGGTGAGVRGAVPGGPEDVEATGTADVDHDAALLAASPFFDAAFYAESAGCDSRPVAAARHYLRRGARRGLHPHPLFATEYAVALCPSLGEGTNALVTYVRERRFDVPTHPLFDLRAYRTASAATATHPRGPLGHYLETGAREGLPPNDWYQPHEAQPRGLVDWVVERHRAWLARKGLVLKARTRRPPDRHEEHPASPSPAEPLVTVVVPAGTDRSTLERTVRSVLGQDLGAREIVVVTDGATDELQSDLDRTFADAPVVVVSDRGSDGTRGARASVGLNLAARVATGDYLAWARPGDVWAPDRLRLMQAV